jgi:TolB-like protein
MKHHHTSARALPTLLVLAFVLVSLVQPRPASAAEAQVTRLAIGPFFAPVASEKLQQAGKFLPELLVAELSHQSRFQLVEREKVQAVWNELHLTASGLVARDNVARLGHLLACDWLVSGTLVQHDGRTVVWTKVLDIRNGVVLDLNASPYDGADLDRTVAAIATFLGQAGTQSKARQFLAMGPFVDMNPRLSAAREDWSKRFAAAIEKHFHEAGFGIVEMGAVTPIFEERRLEAAGLTGHPEQRVKLQAAFWLVDGGCEWTAAGQLNVGLRVQQVGGAEQMFRFTAPADETAEKKLVETIAKALANTNTFPPQLAAKAEADLLAARGMELATRNSPFRPSASAPRKVDGIEQLQQLDEQRKRVGENRASALAAYERTLLLDPKNLEAKTMLGYGLLGDSDPDRRERGQELLREVVATGDPKYTARAQRHLTNAALYASEAAKSARPEVSSTDRDGLERAVAANSSDWKAKFDLGALLMYSLKGTERGRGADLLGEVMDKGPANLATQAREKMPAWALAPHGRKPAPDPTTATTPPARDEGTNTVFSNSPIRKSLAPPRQ